MPRGRSTSLCPSAVEYVSFRCVHSALLFPFLPFTFLYPFSFPHPLSFLVVTTGLVLPPFARSSPATSTYQVCPTLPFPSCSAQPNISNPSINFFCIRIWPRVYTYKISTSFEFLQKLSGLHLHTATPMPSTGQVISWIWSVVYWTGS
jgi:hypothetical protein